MTYKTILVHVHDQKRADRLLEAAVPLARAFDAHLIGLSVLPPIIVLPAGDGAGLSVTIDEHRIAYRADMNRMKETFAEASRGNAFPSEWREADAQLGTVAGEVIDHGRCADLVIASQKQSDWVNSHLLEQPDRIALECGRPVLLLPNAGNLRLTPKRITLAWNGRREAARATFDALPLLKLADVVNVLSINPGDDPTSSRDMPGAEICSALSRHGVKCEASQATAFGPDVGTEILRLAKAFGSDLLVMGCYGHSRLREITVGSVTRTVLAGMAIPVLMAH